MKTTALMTTSVEGHPKRSGKVRDIYDLGDRLVIIATDRISAYDVVMPNGIPDKGRVLTQISLFWFKKLADLTPNHVLSSSLKDLPEEFRSQEHDGRFMICRRCEVIPIECVVRGYLAGSGWREYQKTQSVCGIVLPSGLKQSDKLPAPIFTPATKAASGHDENISFERMASITGLELAEKGTPACFNPHAIVRSTFPAGMGGRKSQRTRWEHGHLGLINRVFPSLFLRSIRSGNFRLTAFSLDLAVPPLALLALLLSTGAFLGAVLALAGRPIPFFLGGAGVLILGGTISLAWLYWGKEILSFRELLSVPWYMAGKIGLYLRFLWNRETDWVRTRRD